MIVPGSILLGHSHLYGWYVRIRGERNDQKEETWWWNCSDSTRDQVAAQVKARFPFVHVLSVEPCTKPPDRVLKPISPKHFQLQYKLINPQLDDPEESPSRPLWKPGHPLPKFTPRPSRKPLWPQHR